jgi:hypothetical protein
MNWTELACRLSRTSSDSNVLIASELSSKIEFSASGAELTSQIIPLVSSSRLELVHQLEDKYSALLPRNSSNHRLFPWFLTTQGQECSPVGDVLDFRLPSGL